MHRVTRVSTEQLINGSNVDTDWKMLKKVTKSAISDFVASKHLNELTAQVVSESLSVMRRHHGANSFSPDKYLYLTVFNLMNRMAFGESSYQLNDTEFRTLRRGCNIFRMMPIAMAEELIPFADLLVGNHGKQTQQLMNSSYDIIRAKFESHSTSHDPATIRSFCDAMLAARRKSPDFDNVTNRNLIHVLFEMFVNGTESTVITLRWALLFMANFPAVQQRLRREVQHVIGNNVPTADHVERCHYIRAFVAEVMRFRPVVPVIVGHVAVRDTTIGGCIDKLCANKSMTFYFQL